MNANDPSEPIHPTAPSQTDRLFPTLTEAQIKRIALRGRRRTVSRGEVLVEVAQKEVPFFVLLRGQIDALQPAAETETLIVTLRPGQFTGEGSMLTGRRALSRLRVSESGEVIELDREGLLALVQTSAGANSSPAGLGMSSSSARRIAPARCA